MCVCMFRWVCFVMLYIFFYVVYVSLGMFRLIMYISSCYVYLFGWVCSVLLCFFIGYVWTQFEVGHGRSALVPMTATALALWPTSLSYLASRALYSFTRGFWTQDELNLVLGDGVGPHRSTLEPDPYEIMTQY